MTIRALSFQNSNSGQKSCRFGMKIDALGILLRLYYSIANGEARLVVSDHVLGIFKLISSSCYCRGCIKPLVEPLACQTVRINVTL